MNSTMIELSEKLRDDFKSTFTRRFEGNDVDNSYVPTLISAVVLTSMLVNAGHPGGAALLGTAILALCYEVENGIKIAIDNTKDAVCAIKEIVRRK